MQAVAVLIRRVHVNERHHAAQAAGLRHRRRERRVVVHAQVLRRAGSANLMQSTPLILVSDSCHGSCGAAHAAVCADVGSSKCQGPVQQNTCMALNLD